MWPKNLVSGQLRLQDILFLRKIEYNLSYIATEYRILEILVWN